MTPDDRYHFEPLLLSVESAIARGESAGHYHHSEIRRLLRAAFDCGDHYIAGYKAAVDAVRYEQACAAREEWQRRAIEAEARLAAAGLGSDIDITCGDIEGRWIEDHLATLDKP